MGLKLAIVREHDNAILLDVPLLDELEQELLTLLPKLARKSKHVSRLHAAYAAVEDALKQRTKELP